MKIEYGFEIVADQIVSGWGSRVRWFYTFENACIAQRQLKGIGIQSTIRNAERPLAEKDTRTPNLPGVE